MSTVGVRAFRFRGLVGLRQAVLIPDPAPARTPRTKAGNRPLLSAVEIRPARARRQGVTMSPLKPCLDCGKLSGGSRCDPCRLAKQRQVDARRGSASSRGYGQRHQRERERWRPRVDAGLVDCARCGEPLEPGRPWDLGHADADRRIWTGPEHAHCNRSAGAVQGNAARVAQRHHSRDW